MALDPDDPATDDAAAVPPEERELVRRYLLDSLDWMFNRASPDGEAAWVRGQEVAALIKRNDSAARVLARHTKALLRTDPEIAIRICRVFLERDATAGSVSAFACARANTAASRHESGAAVRRSAALEALEMARGRGDQAALLPGAVDALEAALLEPALAVSKALAAAGFSTKNTAGVDLRDGEPFCVDEAFIRVLDAIGPEGRDAAEASRNDSKERVIEALRTSDMRVLAKPWDVAERSFSPGYLVTIAWARWHDVVRPPLLPALLAKPLNLEGIRARDGADRHAIVPSVAAGTAWSVGGGGRTVADLCESDAGSKLADFAEAAGVPGFAFVPRTAAFLSRLDRAPQGVLALGFEGESKDPLPVALAKQTGGRDEVLTMVGGKLAFLFLSHKGLRTPGAWRSISLGDLARIVYPAARRIQARELESVAEALLQLNRLRLYLLGCERETPVFAIDTLSAHAKAATRAEEKIVVSIAPPFFLRVDSLGRSRPEYNGGFLYNRDGAMRIDNRKPRLLRYYILAADGWNRDRRDPRNIKPVSIEEMLIRANALPPAAVAALEAKLGKRTVSQMQSSALCEARKRIAEDYEELRAAGLIDLDPNPGKGYVRALPPGDFLEAYNRTPSANRPTGPATPGEAK